MRHKPFHGLHGATLPAQVIHIRIPALCQAPRQQCKAVGRLTLFKAGHISQHHHPPVIGLTLLLPANITCKCDIPYYGSTSGEAVKVYSTPKWTGFRAKSSGINFSNNSQSSGLASI